MNSALPVETAHIYLCPSADHAYTPCLSVISFSPLLSTLPFSPLLALGEFPITDDEVTDDKKCFYKPVSERDRTKLLL